MEPSNAPANEMELEASQSVRVIPVEIDPSLSTSTLPEPDIVTVKEIEPIENLNITISEDLIMPSISEDLIMPSSSIPNEIQNETSEPEEEVEAEPEEEEDNMITSFFSNIFGSDDNSTEEVQPIVEEEEVEEDEENGLTSFISNLFSSADNSTAEEIITNSTQREEEGIMDFFSSFIWDDEKLNKTMSANITA